MATLMATSSELKECIIIGDLVIFSKEIIGQGAFGTVFKGEWRQKPCAAKMLSILGNEVFTGINMTQQGAVKEEALSRFNKECEFMKTLRHPNIVTYYDTLFHPGSNLPVLVMELMNTSLCDYITTHVDSLSERVQLNLCHNIAAALKFLHSKSIIHRDLCGENILLYDSADDIPVAKVTDFGISRKNIDMTHSLTAISHRPGYLPPEAPNYPADYDSSLDIFMFGAVMTQIFGKVPGIKNKDGRQKLVEQLKAAKHPLNPIITQCLDERKMKRPEASLLCAGLHYACELLKSSSTRTTSLAKDIERIDEEMQWLKSIDVNLPAENGSTPLTRASCKGNTMKVKLVLGIGGNVNAQTEAGWTSLTLACYYGYSKVVNELIEGGAKLNLPTNDGDTALHVAISYKHPNIAIELVKKGADLDIYNKAGWTSLTLACYHGYIEVVNELIERRANLNLPTKDGDTALHVAISYKHPNIAIELVKKGADLDIYNKVGWTSLTLACYHGYVEVVNELIERGANLNLRTKDGDTALHIATERKRDDIVRELVKKGTDLDIYNEEGWTSLMVASYYGHTEVVRELGKRGADFNLSTKAGDTALHIATSRKNHGVVKELATWVKNLDETNKDGLTALMVAANKGYKEVVDALLEGGANVHYQHEETDWTALFFAAKNGHVDVFQTLLSRRAEIEITGKDGTFLLVIDVANHQKQMHILSAMGTPVDAMLIRKESFWQKVDMKVRLLDSFILALEKRLFSRCNT